MNLWTNSHVRASFIVNNNGPLQIIQEFLPHLLEKWYTERHTMLKHRWDCPGDYSWILRCDIAVRTENDNPEAFWSFMFAISEPFTDKFRVWETFSVEAPCQASLLIVEHLFVHPQQGDFKAKLLFAALLLLEAITGIGVVILRRSKEA